MSVVISDRVWKSGLAPTLKRYALAYADFAEPDGTRVFPGHATIARMVGTSERSVRTATAALRRLGVLQLVRPHTPGHPALYRFNVEALPSGRQYVLNLESPVRTPEAGFLVHRKLASADPSGTRQYVQRKAKKPADATASPRLLYRVVRTVQKEQPTEQGADLAEAVKTRLAKAHVDWFPDELWTVLDDVETRRRPNRADREFWEAQERSPPRVDQADY